MKFIGLGASALSLALISALGGCGGSGSSSGNMFVETCSLGCSSGANGGEVGCTLVTTYVDQEIDIYFSEPVDPSSVTGQSVQLVDVNSGSVPNGARFLDPLNPHKVVFRPGVTFDEQGNASFGFQANHTYRVTVPGENQNDPAPFVRSTGGSNNVSRMKCDILTSLGVIDLVPGPPTVDIRVDVANPATPNVNDFIPNVEADGATDVWRNSTIRLTFSDLMNPVTLANPTTGQAPFITVQVDNDGNLFTSADRTPLSGNYTITFDPVLLQTLLIFTPANGMTSGDPAFNPLPRKVVVTVPTNCQDLAGNGMTVPVQVAFTPEFVAFAPITLPDANGENFTNTSNCDVSRSNADWGTGRLTRGFGGGSGRLGDLHLTPTQTLVLNTDSTSFPVAGQARDLLDNTLPTTATTPGDYEPLDLATWPPIVVTDGIFEFQSIFIENNAQLVIHGTHYARVFSRGPVNVQGVIDVSGLTPPAHHSDAAGGEHGGAGGPNAGDGGIGASRADYDPSTPGGAALIAVGAIHITDPLVTITPDGLAGGGVGRSGTLASGEGGVHFPANFPTNIGTTPPSIGDVVFSIILFSCQVLQVASPGAGGAYATDGAAAHPATSLPTNVHGTSNLPTIVAQGGQSSDLAIEPPNPESGHLIRRLQADLGNLRGGSGGGGGGLHLFNTTSDDLFASTCMGGGIHIDNFFDQSAGSGGGGGGALQFTSGGNMSFSGVVNAVGGDGGSSFSAPAGQPQRDTRAMPGGAGSGGAVRLQARVLDLTTANPPRIKVDGGLGGVSANLQEDTSQQPVFARGGIGGAGLIRLEDRTGTLTRAGEAPIVSPTDPAIVGPDAENILSVGTWIQPRRRPESYTAGMSCWMKPTGNFYQIVFASDTGVAPNVTYGWNMDVVYDSGTGPQLIPYRGHTPATPQFPNGGTDFETGLGNQLNYGVPENTGSYLAVRFQGALLSGSLSDPCNVTLVGANSQIVNESLTPWVQHPDQLNLFLPRPNMVRFCIIFDISLLQPNGLTGFIKGVTNLKIVANPD